MTPQPNQNHIYQIASMLIPPMDRHQLKTQTDAILERNPSYNAVRYNFFVTSDMLNRMTDFISGSPINGKPFIDEVLRRDYAQEATTVVKGFIVMAGLEPKIVLFHYKHSEISISKRMHFVVMSVIGKGDLTIFGSDLVRFMDFKRASDGFLDKDIETAYILSSPELNPGVTYKYTEIEKTFIFKCLLTPCKLRSDLHDIIPSIYGVVFGEVGDTRNPDRSMITHISEDMKLASVSYLNQHQNSTGDELVVRLSTRIMEPEGDSACQRKTIEWIHSMFEGIASRLASNYRDPGQSSGIALVVVEGEKLLDNAENERDDDPGGCPVDAVPEVDEAHDHEAPDQERRLTFLNLRGKQAYDAAVKADVPQDQAYSYGVAIDAIAAMSPQTEASSIFVQTLTEAHSPSWLTRLSVWLKNV